MINMPYYEESFLKALNTYYTVSLTAMTTVTIPLSSYNRDTLFAQLSSNKITLLKPGKFLFTFVMDMAVTGNMNANPGAAWRVELVKNSTVIASYSAAHNFPTTQTVYARSGFTAMSYWMDSALHNTTTTGTVAGSALSMDCRLIYEDEMNLVAGDQLFLRYIISSNNMASGTLTIRNIQAMLYKLT